MTLRTTSRRTAAALLLVVAAGTSLSACGSDSKKSAAATTPKTLIEGVNVGNATDLTKKPIIDIPDTLPPSKLIEKDIVVGTGATVKTGDSLTARYVGVAWSTNKQFDASWDRAQKEIPFTLAQGSVIDGWTKGLPGMKVGGRRLLIVPPALGYGAQGQGTDIAGGETLVFIVDAKKTAKAPKTSTATSGASSTGGLTQEQLQQALQAQQAQGGTAAAGQ